MTSSRYHPILPTLLLAGLLFTSACDSGGPTVAPEELAGTYTFEQFVFDPDASVLPDANVLDTLVASETRLELFGNDRFTLSYRYRGATSSSGLLGSFDVDDSRVVLAFSGDEAARRRLVLPRELSLRIQENETLLETTQRLEDVDLSQFSDQYQGIGRVDGTLSLRLRRAGS